MGEGGEGRTYLNLDYVYALRYRCIVSVVFGQVFRQGTIYATLQLHEGKKEKKKKLTFHEQC